MMMERLRKWEAARAELPSVLLLMKMGDFVEAFFTDAERMAEVCSLTLYRMDDGTPCCSVLWEYRARCVEQLVARGYRVALCEEIQNEDLLPSQDVSG